MTRIMVFGSGGLLGSSLVPYLRLRGHEVRGNSTRNGETDVRVDLTDSIRVTALLDQVRPTVIINLVALADVDQCERSPQRAYFINVRSVENLRKWITTASEPCHLIHISTDQVYDGVGAHLEDNVTLSNYYGFSKYASELVAASVHGTILRTNFFGPSLCADRVSFSDWLVNSLKGGGSISVFEDIYFSPLSLQSMIELLCLTVENPQRGLFNLGSRQGMSKADFAFMLAETLGLTTEYMKRSVSTAANMFAYRPKDMRMDSSRFEEKFAIKLPTLQEEIRSMKAAYEAR